MKEYEVIVIGSGAGMIVTEAAVSHGLKVALVDKGPLGGTCLNVGCIPSKMLIAPADRVVEIQEAKRLGIDTEIIHINFNLIMEQMRKMIKDAQDHMRRGIMVTRNLDFYEAEAQFTDEYTLEIKGKRIKGEKIFIASGARPSVPPIKGLDKIAFLTNENVLKLEKRPESLIIIGGGYIAAEYGHFFAAMGTEVTIMQRRDRLVPNEEPEIADLLKREMAKRMRLLTNTAVTEVKKTGEGYAVIGKDKSTNEEQELHAEEIMIATGRRSNADLLKVENTGVETDEQGFIKVNDYLETSKTNIWAFGDAIGKQMFRHVANREALVAWHNSIHAEKVKMNYHAIPHAVFSHPQIASVGLTEAQARTEHEILVGKAYYSEVAMGEAMRETESFAKAIVDKQSRKILGFHIIGPYAPILIQEVSNTMAHDRDMRFIANGIHIHPALSELILVTLQNLRTP
ncbi:MAG: dihydrolipoyl dehydrogenase [Methanophagales archaeon ANME-1-THS]|nr:MAG: dihydrolipoyl dehydrogenase [Methanophagales archaeon ANME-1-THS]